MGSGYNIMGAFSGGGGAGVTITTTEAYGELFFGTTSASYVDATDFTHTLTDGGGLGGFSLNFTFCFSISTTGASTRLRGVHGTTNLTEWFVNSRSFMADQTMGNIGYVGDTDGTAVKIQTLTSGGTFSLLTSSNRGSGEFFEVS